jgi:hypothetical protein
MLVPDDMPACIYCGAPISQAMFATKDKEQMGCGSVVLLGGIYALVWPSVSLFVMLRLFSAIPACEKDGCKSVERLLDGLPNLALVSIAALIVAIFIATFKFKAEKNRYLQLILSVHRYACFLAPGLAGYEGFGLPAPFLVAIAIDVTYPPALRMPLLLFGLTWVVVFLVFILGFFLRPPSDIEHINAPDIKA